MSMSELERRCFDVAAAILMKDPRTMPLGDVVRAVLAEAGVAEMRQTIVAFAGPWAAQYARDFGLPDGHLHPTHYDILEKSGARMDDFTRAKIGVTQ